MKFMILIHLGIKKTRISFTGKVFSDQYKGVMEQLHHGSPRVAEDPGAVGVVCDEVEGVPIKQRHVLQTLLLIASLSIIAGGKTGVRALVKDTDLLKCDVCCLNICCIT